MNSRIVFVAIASLLAAPVHAGWTKPEAPDFSNWKDADIYVGLEVGRSKTDHDAAGVNTLGFFQNWGQDQYRAKSSGIKIGADYTDWRFDLSYREYSKEDFVTLSFPGSPGPAAFFYRGDSKIKAGFLSAYFDFIKEGKLDVYLGVGVGAADVDVSVNDFVVRGSGSQTNFAWQAELGIDYHVIDSLTLSAGVRRVDLGSPEIDMVSVGGAVPSGDYEMDDLKSTEAYLGIRYSF